MECRLQRHSAEFVVRHERSGVPSSAPLRFAAWRTTSKRHSASLRGVLRTEFVVRHGTKWSAVFSATPLRCVAHYKQAPLRFAAWRTTSKRHSASLRGVLRTEFVVRHERSGVPSSAPLRFAAWRTTSKRHSASLRGVLRTEFVVRHGTKWSAVFSATPQSS